jgi:ABC-type transport system substrate-binding protein
MDEQAKTLALERRRAIFTEVQNVLAENVPVLYFASPRLYYAHSRRMRGVVPSILRPIVLWNADSFSISSAR